VTVFNGDCPFIRSVVSDLLYYLSLIVVVLLSTLWGGGGFHPC
jgi:hypothetical protein